MLPDLLLKFAPARVPFFKYYKSVGPQRGQIVKFPKAFSKLGCPAGGKSGGKSKNTGGKRGIMRGLSRTRGQNLFPDLVFSNCLWRRSPELIFLQHMCLAQCSRGTAFTAHDFLPWFLGLMFCSTCFLTEVPRAVVLKAQVFSLGPRACVLHGRILQH